MTLGRARIFLTWWTITWWKASCLLTWTLGTDTFKRIVTLETRCDEAAGTNTTKKALDTTSEPSHPLERRFYIRCICALWGKTNQNLQPGLSSSRAAAKTPRNTARCLVEGGVAAGVNVPALFAEKHQIKASDMSPQLPRPEQRSLHGQCRGPPRRTPSPWDIRATEEVLEAATVGYLCTVGLSGIRVGT